MLPNFLERNLFGALLLLFGSRPTSWPLQSKRLGFWSFLCVQKVGSQNVKVPGLGGSREREEEGGGGAGKVVQGRRKGARRVGRFVIFATLNPKSYSKPS